MISKSGQVCLAHRFGVVWGRVLLPGNLGQQFDIEDRRREIQELRRKVQSGSCGAVRSIELRLDILERQSDSRRT